MAIFFFPYMDILYSDVHLFVVITGEFSAGSIEYEKVEEESSSMGPIPGFSLTAVSRGRSLPRHLLPQRGQRLFGGDHG